jgi:hypothetical protein
MTTVGNLTRRTSVRRSLICPERSPGSFELRYSLGTDPATGKRNIAIDTLLTKVRPKDEPIPPADDCEFRPAIRPEAANRVLALAGIIARGL